MKHEVGARTAGFVLGSVLVAASVTAAQETARVELAAQVQESVEVSDLFVFNTSTRIDGATVLVRDLKGQLVEASVSTLGLEPEVAYSIWWAVFNRPEYCKVAYRCGLGDLEVQGGDPRVQVSVFWGGGLVADSFGSGQTSLRLLRGRTRRELFANSKDYGLRNVRGAEIHVVLRSHGPAGVAGPVSEQLGTAFAACPPTGCFNAFNSIHRAQ